jgi:hydroxymethylbilane synthase
MSDLKKKKLVIGSRGSELALWQANYVKQELEKLNSNFEIEIKVIKTKGDKILDTALSKIGDKGLFTKELEIKLLNDEIDIAVHSLKDLQTEIPKGLKLGSITKRHKVEDVLIARRKGITIHNIKFGATVATGSLRRKAQLKHLRPDINIVELRGNVPTRIEQFLKSNWDAIILARAGIERLKLDKHISSIIDKDVILPAVGQGALGIEIKRTNKLAEQAIKKLNDENTFAAVSAERSFLKALEGGCQIPIGSYAEVRKSGLYLTGIVATVEGDVTLRKTIRGSKKNPESIGRKLANDMIKVGAKEILRGIYESR